LLRSEVQMESYSCELCLLQKEERLRHLFFRCPFAKNCWLLIGVKVPTWLRPHRAVRLIKRQLRVPFVMELITIMYWSIWTERNAWLFKNEAPTITSCKETFKKELSMVVLRSRKRYTSALKQWLQSFV
jgi:hypothetical protein